MIAVVKGIDPNRLRIGISARQRGFSNCTWSNCTWVRLLCFMVGATTVDCTGGHSEKLCIRFDLGHALSKNEFR
jgi:hypothetical protein